MGCHSRYTDKCRFPNDPSSDPKREVQLPLGALPDTQYQRVLDGIVHPDPRGSLYKVDLPDSAIGKMLDWDKPLSQQPESVRKAIQAIDPAIPLTTKGGQAYSYIRGALDNPKNSPEISS